MDKGLETWLIGQENLLLEKTHMATHNCLYSPLSLLASTGLYVVHRHTCSPSHIYLKINYYWAGKFKILSLKPSSQVWTLKTA